MRSYIALLVLLCCAGPPAASPQQIPNDPGGSLRLVALTAGDGFTCGLTDGGAAFCWGANHVGQLGTGTEHECPAVAGAQSCTLDPQPVAGNLSFTQIDAGSDHVCGVTREGEAYCWGNNVTGALGTAVPLDSCVEDAGRLPRDLLPGCSRVPVPVAGDVRFTSLSAGNVLTCGSTSGGEAYCWGMSDAAPHGRVLQPTPRRLPEDRKFSSVTTDFYRPCALDEGGAVYCWDAWLTDAPSAVPAPASLTQLSRGWGHTCGLAPDGVAYCWGTNADGQVGTGRTPEGHERIPVPTRVAGAHRFKQISAGFGRTCGITTGDALYCWGDRAGAPGNAECFHVDAYSDCTPQPIRVLDQRGRSVAIGGVHTCAVTIQGAGYCWGSNYGGAFGDGRHGVVEERPVRVVWRSSSGSGR